jgi:hypothetical protein
MLSNSCALWAWLRHRIRCSKSLYHPSLKADRQGRLCDHPSGLALQAGEQSIGSLAHPWHQAPTGCGCPPQLRRALVSSSVRALASMANRKRMVEEAPLLRLRDQGSGVRLAPLQVRLLARQGRGVLMMRSNARPDDPSPRPTSLCEPSQTTTLPSRQRVRW